MCLAPVVNVSYSAYSIVRTHFQRVLKNFVYYTMLFAINDILMRENKTKIYHFECSVTLSAEEYI